MDQASHDAGETDNDGLSANNNQQEQSQDLPMLSPTAREHSYLPGTVHSIHFGLTNGDSVTTNRRNSSYSVNGSTSESSLPSQLLTQRPQQTLQELAVMELDNVIVFPGDILPIRVVQPFWIDYLSQQIEQLRRQSNSTMSSHDTPKEIRFGVLPKGIARPVSQHHDVDEESSRRGSNHTDDPPQPGRTGWFGRNPRQLWTRRGVGPRRLSRFSQRLIEELGDLDDLLNDDESTDNDGQEDVMVVMVVGQNDEQQRQEDRPESDDRDRYQGLDGDQHQHEEDADETGGEMENDEEDNEDISIAEVDGANERGDVFMGWDVIRERQQRDRAAEENRQDRPIDHEMEADVPVWDWERMRQAPIEPSEGNRESLSGRLGTIVTVMYHHVKEGDNPYASRIQDRNRREIVITALGTSRFRIVSSMHDGNSGVHRQFGPVQVFLVEEMIDSRMDLPTTPHYVNRRPPDCDAKASFSSIQQRQIIQYLSSVTPIPPFVFNRFWPWKRMARIRDILKSFPTFTGVCESLALFEREHGRLDDPHKFSYWMSANLPFRQDEKLYLLEVESTPERLNWIRQKLLKVAMATSLVLCKLCGSPIGKVSDMFTVGGAEGTTGNYVNEYGIVHQTITLRTLNEQEVQYSGRAETRDSWFPGYSWTIMSCFFCSAHLGWKFLKVDEGGPNDRDRPRQFFGLSAGNVDTLTTRPRNRGSVETD